MSPAHVLDKYYLAITVFMTIFYQLLGFAIAWTFQFDKITDFTGGSNFFILALVTLLMGNTFYARNIVASVFVMVWASRLAGFLLFRVLKTGSDTRFDDIRSHFFKFLGFWIGQILWVWTVSLPVTILNSPAGSASNPSFGKPGDIIGIILFGLGSFIEATADVQKYRWKAASPPKDQPCATGLWKWSRHPNYYSEMMCWWGIWAICLTPATYGNISSGAKAALRGSVVSPLFTMILLTFLSGIPTAEKPTARRYFLLSYGPKAQDSSSSQREYPEAWNNYKRYLTDTSLLIPLPPVLYRHIPGRIKRTLLLDWKMWRFDERADGEKAIEEERQNQRADESHV